MSDKSDAAALERMTTMMLDAEAHKQRERTFVENEFAPASLTNLKRKRMSRTKDEILKSMTDHRTTIQVALLDLSFDTLELARMTPEDPPEDERMVEDKPHVQ